MLWWWWKERGEGVSRGGGAGLSTRGAASKSSLFEPSSERGKAGRRERELPPIAPTAPPTARIAPAAVLAPTAPIAPPTAPPTAPITPKQPARLFSRGSARRPEPPPPPVYRRPGGIPLPCEPRGERGAASPLPPLPLPPPLAAPPSTPPPLAPSPSPPPPRISLGGIKSNGRSVLVLRPPLPVRW